MTPHADGKTAMRDGEPPVPGIRLRDAADTPDLIVIPAGSFLIGAADSDDQAHASEKPVPIGCYPRPSGNMPAEPGPRAVAGGPWPAVIGSGS